MSKLYNKYLKLKEKDNNKLYLFRSGKFYIFIDKDCDLINEYIVLKKTKLTKDIYKCGFPKESLNSYLRVFKNQKLAIEVIENESIETKLSEIDIDNITPIDALIKLKELKELL